MNALYALFLTGLVALLAYQMYVYFDNSLDAVYLTVLGFIVFMLAAMRWEQFKNAAKK